MIAGGLFKPEDMTEVDVTNVEILREIRRELQMRERVYPVWVRQGKLPATEAARRTLILEAIYTHYDKLVQQELQAELPL